MNINHRISEKDIRELAIILQPHHVGYIRGILSLHNKERKDDLLHLSVTKLMTDIADHYYYKQGEK
jgi:hypothetical protein